MGPHEQPSKNTYLSFNYFSLIIMECVKNIDSFLKNRCTPLKQLSSTPTYFGADNILGKG
jgi:hypothetical protein